MLKIAEKELEQIFLKIVTKNVRKELVKSVLKSLSGDECNLVPTFKDFKVCLLNFLEIEY